MKFNLASLSFAVAIAAALAGCHGPEAEGFFEGGIIGAACPPGTESWGTCNGDDCTVACYATTPCESAEDDCPHATKCDVDLAACMPIPCTDSSDCELGASCNTDRFSQPACSR